MLSRGIIGTRTVEGAPIDFVSSPVFKEAFDLRTGVCLDNPDASVPAYEVEVHEGVIYVGAVKAAKE